MKKLLVLMCLSTFVSASKANYYWINPDDSSTGCEFSLYIQDTDGNKQKHLSYPNHPIKNTKVSLQECINSALTSSSLEGEGNIIEISHDSLNDRVLEIHVKH